MVKLLHCLFFEYSRVVKCFVLNQIANQLFLYYYCLLVVDVMGMVISSLTTFSGLRVGCRVRAVQEIPVHLELSGKDFIIKEGTEAVVEARAEDRKRWQVRWVESANLPVSLLIAPPQMLAYVGEGIRK